MSRPRRGWQDWEDYFVPDFSFVDFKPRSTILDLGCGIGEQLGDSVGRGCRGFGTELDGRCLEICRARGLRVIKARAEAIPVRTASLDGMICKVVIPYTYEPDAFREIGRVLRTGARIYFAYHGVGYYLRYVFTGDWRHRVYGLRTLVNSWVRSVTGHHLPGFLGDTVYQTRRHLDRFYRRHGLRLLENRESRRFLGCPVFIYHTVEKVA